VNLEIEGLEKGTYNIVPCVFDPKKEGTFKLTTSRGTLSELDPKKEYKELVFTVLLTLRISFIHFLHRHSFKRTDFVDLFFELLQKQG
jgi:hypothetical protein